MKRSLEMASETKAFPLSLPPLSAIAGEDDEVNKC